MKVVIIKYNAGNVSSVTFALERLGISPILSDKVAEIQAADKVIFPGVGEASSTMNYLKNKQLDQVITNLKQPVLGVCLGMQLLCKHSAEGNTPCLGVFEQQVLDFNQQQKTTKEKLKVPHVGWNNFAMLKTTANQLFANIQSSDFVYFVHSFFVELGTHTTATTEYILPFSAALQKDNFYAAQFHPEKSSTVGEKIIKNFLDI
jgi:imidazole glycerol-phosphate synthase subunit HisH